MRNVARRASRYLQLIDALGPFQHNGTWALGASGWVNTPTLGAELLTDPGLEAWTTATNLTSWTEFISGTSTINQETVDMHGGSNAARLDVDASNSNVSITQASVATIGNWYQLLGWLKNNLTAKTVSFGTTNNPWPAAVTKTITTSYVQYIATGRATGTGVAIGRSTATSSSVYIDDLSFKALTLNQLILGKPGTNVNVTPTLVTSTQAGFVCRLDSLTTPLYGLFGYHDGVNVNLVKLVNGVWTSLIATAVTYVAGADMHPVFVDANTVQLWYNGAQRGTNQSISDVGSGVYAGAFSTYSGNTVPVVVS